MQNTGSLFYLRNIFSTSFRLVYRANVGHSPDAQTRGGREQRNNKKYLSHKAMTLYIINFLPLLHTMSNITILNYESTVTYNYCSCYNLLMKRLTSALPVFVLMLTSTHFIFKRCNSLVILWGTVKVIVAFSDRNIDPFHLPRVSDFFRTSSVFPSAWNMHMNMVILFCIILCIVTIIGSHFVSLTCHSILLLLQGIKFRYIPIWVSIV
jgi:hypothetical protein